jgi:hypothetical protein
MTMIATKDFPPGNCLNTRANELGSIADQLRVQFPEEVSHSDLSDPTTVLSHVKELLDRLWRWES